MAPKLPTRKVGDAQVSAIGYGAMGISSYYGAAAPDEERFKLLDAVYEAGCTNWDTADVYGDSEELIGNWFKRTGKRNEIFLATKFGANPPSGRIIDCSPEYVKQAANKSLERLGVDYIDLFYAHRADPTVPIEHTVGALAELVKEGKVKYIGISECSGATLRRAYKVHPIAAIQVEYSPFTLDPEDPKIGALQAARELGVAVFAYSPLGRGLLTGNYKSPDDFAEDDMRRIIPRYSRENFPNVLKVVEEIRQIGTKHNATAGQVTLAWLLAQGPEVIPIPGTRSVKYLNENLGSLNVKLTPEEVQEVREIAVRADSVLGDRYPAAAMDTLYVDTPPL
ncbi:NADP-dependent oxidoreductase domain-containing protein [Gloeopeniophorella convolvens]|nr:NADP-dependent oxidoreductase domain-containing protein [Gloeopeniophorella convolvens]